MVEKTPPDPAPAGADEPSFVLLAEEDESTLTWDFPVKSKSHIVVRHALEIAAVVIVLGTIVCFMADMLGIARSITSQAWPIGLVGCLVLLVLQLAKGPWL